MRIRASVFRLAPLALAVATAHAATDKLDPQLRRALAVEGTSQALIEVDTLAATPPLDPSADYRTRRRVAVDLLRAQAQADQAALVAWLKQQGVPHRAFWITNAVWVKADAATLERIAARSDVRGVHANPVLHQNLPPAEAPATRAPAAIDAVEWGVTKIRAPLAWAAGVTGQGVVIAGEDTGYEWTHPALKSKYRGWDGATATHAYNWHDGVQAIVVAGSPNPTCAYASPAPCDDNSHGTHTLGTMVGDDGAGNQTGVAPGARWIGCRNMDAGNGRPNTYLDCMQWMLAPYDTDSSAGDPDKAPDVISNSWGCPSAAPPTGEGCTPPEILKTAVENLVHQGGIFFAAAAGNDGSNCATILDPPAIYDAAFVVGSTTSADAMSGFSSRGPVSGLDANKPDVVAPGSSVRSTVPGGGYGTKSGTSMAAPHVAGAAALVMSVNPALKGHPDQVAAILRTTAVHITSSQVCGGVPATTFPNPVQGYGRIDAYAAVILADTIFKTGLE